MRRGLEQRIARERRRLVRAGARAEAVRAVVSPYRICPLGAHIDHQRGPVLGMAIEAHTLLVYAPTHGSACRVESANFEGEVRFDLREPVPPGGRDWGRYARAAAWALSARLPARPRGFVARVSGDLPDAGLSSSASVLLAYLLALADVNAVSLSAEELVALSRRAENEFVGLASGILDPASIAAARRGQLLSVDTARSRWQPVALGAAAPAYRILVAFSGLGRSLTATPFNERVAECGEAATRLARRAGCAGVRVLGDLPEELLAGGLAELPPPLRRRARHFRDERARVREGCDAWRRGDLERFGQLMRESCRSSIECYETGSPELVELQRILCDAPGVYGARFCGGGFGGSSVALVAAEEAERARAEVERAFVAEFPRLAGRARAFLVASDDGLRLA